MINRLPKLDQIVPVYAVIAFMTFGWMILVFLWKLPSWLYFQTLFEILAILAYAFMQIFLESLLYLAILLVVCMILPPRFLKDSFTVRGAWIAFAVLSSLLLYLTYLSRINLRVTLSFALWSAATILLAGGLAWISPRISWLSKIALVISDRLIIFLYILVPVSLISLVTVLVRNVF